MDLKNLIKKVQDVAKSEQTDKLKKELYDMILPFVRKYQPLYYRQFKGNLEDLASDFFVEFMTPKSRIEGKEESLLDKFDPAVTTLPYLVKQSVIRMLIDRSRTDKGEINYSENYDEESGDLTLDFLRGDIPEEEIIQIEDREFDDDFIEDLVAKYKQLPEKAKKDFLNYYAEVKNVLSENFQVMFEKAALDKPFKGYVARISGKAPDFKVTISSSEGTEEITERARHEMSVRAKIQTKYPGIRIEDSKIKFPSRKLSDSARQFFSSEFLRVEDSKKS